MVAFWAVTITSKDLWGLAEFETGPILPMMTLKISRNSAYAGLLAPGKLFTSTVLMTVFGAGLAAAVSCRSQVPAATTPATPGSAPASPYGGTIVEQAVARVNDQIITTSDYDRAMKEADSEARQRGMSMQQIAEGHRDILRNLIDQQLWLSKGKELGITGETELVKQLDEIRKKYNLETMEDLEKAAHDQGVSFEDFKANIRNQVITQQVMRDEVGRKVSVTPGEMQRYFEAHKKDYVKPEGVRLSEIMVSTGTDPDDAKLATAKAKADDLEARLKAGEDFDKLARSSSDGQTAAQGGDLGKYGRGELAKVLEDKTFDLKAGEFTEPIRTKQGYVILKVVDHSTGGAPEYKDVQPQVEEAFYMSRMEPAIRAYLNRMREEAYIVIRPGYTDTAATPNEVKPTISYAAYTPPPQKKKKKVTRTRFRETEHGFRKKEAQPVPIAVDTTSTKAAGDTTADTATADNGKKAKKAAPAATSMKAGKKEKIRFGQAPRETLPGAADTKVEDAGAVQKPAPAADQEQAAAPAVVEKKTRYSARMKLAKDAKPKGPQLDSFTPAAPDAAEVADRQTQAAPLGFEGDQSKKKKKKGSATTGDKTRMQDRPKDTTPAAAPEITPAAPVLGAPAPATAPEKKEKGIPAAPTSSAPQQTPTSPDPPQAGTSPNEPPH